MYIRYDTVIGHHVLVANFIRTAKVPPGTGVSKYFPTIR